MTELILVVLGGLKFGAIYALAAVGLVTIHKATRTVNFAHGAFVLLGAFIAYLLTVEWRLSPWFAYIAAPLAVGALAAGLELLILRPLRHADVFSAVVATIFLGIAISEIFRLGSKAELLAVPPLFALAPIEIGDLIIVHETLWTIAGAVFVGISAVLVFHRAKIGRGMRAMASNSRGAQLCGYSVNGVFASAWFFGGALAGLAGVFAAPATGVSPDFAVSIVAAAFVAAVLGGFNSLGGAVIGGLILGVSETLAAAYVSSAFKNAISFVLLFAILLWRPQGLFPEAKTRNV